MQKMTPGYSLLQFSLRLSPVLDCNGFCHLLYIFCEYSKKVGKYDGNF